MIFSHYLAKSLLLTSEASASSTNNSILTRSSVTQISGFRSLPWIKPEKTNSCTQTLLDIDWLTMQASLPFLLQVIPTHLLYKSIMSYGFEDSLEIIEWIRGSQLQKIFDFDLWEKKFDSEIYDISINKFISWLRAWFDISPSFAAERFLELEEENITLIMSALFEIIPDGVSYVTEDVRENWWQTLDNRFFIRIKENEQEYFEILKNFVDALYAYNIKLAGSIFAYSAMLTRQESLEEGLRWRENRLADQGFVSTEDAHIILRPKKPEELKKLIHQNKELEIQRQLLIKKSTYQQTNISASNTPSFNEESLDAIVHLLGQLKPEEGVKQIQFVLGQESVKQITGSQNIAAEHFYDDEDFINESAEKILAHCEKILNNIQFSISKKTINNTQNQLIIDLLLNHISSSDDLIYIQDLKSRMAHLANVMTSAYMNSVDNDALNRALLTVRGAINLGLEIALNEKDYYNFTFQHENKLDNCIHLIKDVGLEFIFQLAWSKLHSLGFQLVSQVEHLTKHKSSLHWLNPYINIQFSDGTFTNRSISQLFQTSRISDVQRWLQSLEPYLPIEIYIVWQSLLNAVPMYPLLLNESADRAPTYLSMQVRSFETLKDVKLIEDFIKNMGVNLESLLTDKKGTL